MLTRRLTSSSAYHGQRIAIVGAGPAGFYAATRLLSLYGQQTNIKIDMFELLPTPFGLARFGVAPDHPEVKNCQHKFEETAQDERVRFFGNVQIGSDIVPNLERSQHAVQIDIETLRQHYDATLLTYGASLDRQLNIPGETTLSNVLSARTFVNWYNGHPYHSSLLSPLIDLKQLKHVTVVGQGNVALDVARILLKPTNELTQFDVPEPVLEQLTSSRVERVDIVGRRGPLQLACTTKEVREMMNLANVGFETDNTLLQQAIDWVSNYPTMQGHRAKKRLIGLLQQGSKSNINNSQKSWSFQFLKSPIELLSNEQGQAPTPVDMLTSPLDSVGQIKWDLNEFVVPRESSTTTTTIQDIVANDPNLLQVKPTGQQTITSTDLVLKSVGYRSIGLPGLPFDDKRGIISNNQGRVVNEQGQMIPGLYTCGWLARGPTGVIATTMFDSFSTADLIHQDLLSNLNQQIIKPELNLKEITKNKQIVNWKDWQRIDQEEKRRGQIKNKLREKMTDVGDMLKFLSS
ncbi:NADPH-adrenodoxin reductase [Microbotryomycetes sp. JL221]|nr:NADPH-adrenodoxin reductase [Microbotryomycetes sp. JL221]